MCLLTGVLMATPSINTCLHWVLCNITSYQETVHGVSLDHTSSVHLRNTVPPRPLCECAGWGLFVCMLSMLSGGVVEMVRLSLFKQGHVLTDDKNAIVDMSVFWQIPQYILVGLSEVCSCIAC